MLALIFTTMLVSAQETIVPEQFKRSKIQRVLSDGTVQEFDDTYAIVPRKPKSKKKDDPVIYVVGLESKKEQQSGVRVTLLGGVAPNGLFTENIPSFGTIVSMSNGFVGGGSVQWDMDSKRTYHGQMTILSNGTFVFGVGVELD